MKKSISALIPALAAVALVLGACASTPAAAPAASAAPATQAAAAEPAAAPAAAPATEASAPAITITTPDNAWVLDSFERLTTDGRILLGDHPSVNWVNLSDAGWGGWKSSGFALSSSTEHATQGSHSMLITLNGKISTRAGNGACFGVNWDNDGPTSKDKAAALKKAAYVAIDYTWEPSEETTMANPYLGFNLHANGTDDSLKSQAIIGGEYYVANKGSGTAIIKLTKPFNDKVTRMPQFSLKVFTAMTKGDENKVDASESGKKLKGMLWIDNLRFVDAQGAVLTL